MYWYLVLCQALDLQRWDAQSSWALRSLPARAAPRTDRCAHPAIGTTTKVSLSPQPPSPKCSVHPVPTAGEFWCSCFLEELFWNYFPTHSISFMLQNPTVRFWPRSCFKLVVETQHCKVTTGIMGTCIKVLCLFWRENCLALQREVVVVLSTIPCASGNHRKFWWHLHAFLTIHSFCNLALHSQCPPRSQGINNGSAVHDSVTFKAVAHVRGTLWSGVCRACTTGRDGP